MQNGKTTIERAFELARAGGCRHIDDIRRTLKAERHEGVDAHLSGRAIAAQLRALLAGRA